MNGITANNPEAIPMQAADEAVAEKFLTLLTGFFALLPDEMVSSGLYLSLIHISKRVRYRKLIAD